MDTMMALRAQARGSPEQLVYEQAPASAAGLGEALIAVHAAAITFAELTWDLSWTTRDGTDRTPVAAIPPTASPAIQGEIHLALAFAVSIASHLLFPVTIARPAVPPEGGLSMRPTPPTGRSASSRASTLPSRDPVEGTGPVSDGVSGPRLASYLIGVTRRGTGVQPN